MRLVRDFVVGLDLTPLDRMRRVRTAWAANAQLLAQQQKQARLEAACEASKARQAAAPDNKLEVKEPASNETANGRGSIL